MSSGIGAGMTSNAKPNREADARLSTGLSWGSTIRPTTRQVNVPLRAAVCWSSLCANLRHRQPDLCAFPLGI